jgi:hypothetical protein
MKKKLTPEDRAEIERVLEEGREGRRKLQAKIDAFEARVAARIATEPNPDS